MRSAIVGTGAVAVLHAEALALQPEVELVTVASIAGAEEFAAKFDVPHVYASIEDLLEHEDLDVVHLCTPPAGHKDQALAAMEAGCHVIVEKPAALTLSDLDTMLEAADRLGKRCVVVFQQRSGSTLASIRAKLMDGTLGRPLIGQANTLWFRDADYFDVPWRGSFGTEGGGTLLNHSIHQIDLLAHLLGDWDNVSARMWTLDREISTEDTVVGSIEFASGAVASVFGSVLAPAQVSAVRVDTTEVTIDLGHLYGHRRENWSVTDRAGADLVDDELDVPSGHEDFLSQVYAALLTGTDLPEIAAHPARSMEIVSALYASAARDGAPVTRADLASDASLRGSLAMTPRKPREH